MMKFGMLGFALAATLTVQAANASTIKPQRPDQANRLPTRHRGLTAESKLSADLQALYEYTRPSRGANKQLYTPAELQKLYDVQVGNRQSQVTVAINSTGDLNDSVIKRYGGSVYLKHDSITVANVPVGNLLSIASAPNVKSIAGIARPEIPPAPQSRKGPKTLKDAAIGRAANGSGDFDHKGLTGKGVIVAIVDTGIDLQHEDFRNPDGTTRVLELWDMNDTSWKDSNGAVGTKPAFDDKDGNPIGTVYTRDQINDYLKGNGKIASHDAVGHGTACAGTAAGNGRAAGNGVDAGTYKGVAPEADLIVVKASVGDTGSFNGQSYLAAGWVAGEAAKFNEPCVINESWGGQSGPHDGTALADTVTNLSVPADSKGLALCVSAGNDGEYSLHAGGRFGPKQEGQADIDGDPRDLFVTKQTVLTAYFDHDDQWGLCVAGLDNFLTDANGKPAFLFVEHKADGEPDFLSGNHPAQEDQLKQLVDTYSYTVVDGVKHKEDELHITLPPGRYQVWGYGAESNVADGTYDLYLPFTQEGTFGMGADKHKMIGMPGDSDNAITVGAYYFRGSWENMDGKATNYNMAVGNLATYSSPGYRRDGVVKPDIVAPASFTISSLADGCEMGKKFNGDPDTVHITKDGKHVAWEGTSAASPYTAGVVALMLQKNPTLTTTQIRSILAKSATQDAFTGGLPNPEWGNGKLNPSAAIDATPAP